MNEFDLVSLHLIDDQNRELVGHLLPLSEVFNTLRNKLPENKLLSGLVRVIFFIYGTTLGLIWLESQFGRLTESETHTVIFQIRESVRERSTNSRSDQIRFLDYSTQVSIILENEICEPSHENEAGVNDNEGFNFQTPRDGTYNVGTFQFTIQDGLLTDYELFDSEFSSETFFQSLRTFFESHEEIEVSFNSTLHVYKFESGYLDDNEEHLWISQSGQVLLDTRSSTETVLSVNSTPSVSPNNQWAIFKRVVSIANEPQQQLVLVNLSNQQQSDVFQITLSEKILDQNWENLGGDIFYSVIAESESGTQTFTLINPETTQSYSYDIGNINVMGYKVSQTGSEIKIELLFNNILAEFDEDTRVRIIRLDSQLNVTRTEDFNLGDSWIISAVECELTSDQQR